MNPDLFMQTQIYPDHYTFSNKYADTCCDDCGFWIFIIIGDEVWCRNCEAVSQYLTFGCAE